MDVHFDLNGESFVWDAGKAKKNLAKHGVRFEEAATGFDSSGRLLYVVHIGVEGDFIRIISARRAELSEEQHHAF